MQMNEDGDSRLTFGIGAGLPQAALDGSKLNPAQQGDYDIPTTSQSAILPGCKGRGVIY